MSIKSILNESQKKTGKKCQYHGNLKIDEIYISQNGYMFCLLCKQKKPPTTNIIKLIFKELKCRKCKVIKNINEFYSNPKINSLCKSCDKIRKQKYRNKPEIKQKEYLRYMERFYKKKYGITFNDYQEMLEKQKGLCAICRNPNTGIDKRSKKIKRLNIDHYHNTGKVRGLLCTKCNHGIGLFQDNILLFESCIRYIQHGYIEDKFIQLDGR